MSAPKPALWRRLQPLAWLLLIVVLAYAAPLLAGSPYTMRLVNMAALNAILVLGVNFITGLSGELFLAQAAFWGIGAYSSGVLTLTYHLPISVGLVAAIIIAALCGYVLAVVSTRLEGHYLAFITLAFQAIAYQIFRQWRTVTGGPTGLKGIPHPVLGALTFENDFTFWPFILLGLAVAALVAVRIQRSHIGRALTALRQGPLAAALMGVDVRGAKILAMVLCAAYGGLAGGLYAHMDGFVSPDLFEFDRSVLYISMLVVGGLGSVPGAVVGAVLLTFLPEWFRVFQGWYLVVYGLALLLVMVKSPRGLIPAVVRWVGMLRAAGRSRSQGPTGEA